MQQFDLIIIGGGPGGYLCAERAGKAGLRTALLEKRALGGTCLNEGCIPTKSLLYCAKQYQTMLHCEEYGIAAQNVSYDHAAAVVRKDGIVQTLVRGVGAAMKKHGVTVFPVEGKIAGKTGDLFTVSAGEELLYAPKLVLASGSSAVVPPIPGVREGLASGFVMTNRELLSLQAKPDSLVCIGGGVIGLEMACYFASIGTKVTVIEMMSKIAGNTDPEICALLMRTYKKQGMEFCLNAKVESLTEHSVIYSDASGKHEISCDRVLLSAGRRADVSGLNTEAIGVALERGAVVTDEHMRTNIPGVWAIGDCNGKLMLAHTAYREAEVAVNDMLGKKDRVDYSIIPSVIYTTPEVASVGETEQSALEKGLDIQVVKAPMALSGRYLAENPKGTGFCKLLYDRKNRCVVGVHLIGSYASEIIYGAAMMVHSKLPVQHLDKIVFPHPTVGEVVREALFML